MIDDTTNYTTIVRRSLTLHAGRSWFTEQFLGLYWFMDTNAAAARFPHEAHASMSGTARHEFYERHNEDGILAEVRLAIRMPSGRVITGQIDRYLPAHHRIEDYKFKTEDHAPFNKAPLNYVAQQNIYRYMLMQGCVIHETGEVIPPQEEITDLILYPSNHKDWLEVRCPIWPFERVEWYIETMLDFFEASQDPNYLPPRVHANLKTDRWCQNYCPLVNYCVAAGGEEVRDVLVEAATR